MVKLPEQVGIAEVRGLRDVLLAAVASAAEAEPVELDASEVRAVDVAGLQLLCATHRQADSGHHALVVRSPGALRTAAAASGFRCGAGCPSGCIHEEVDRG